MTFWGVFWASFLLFSYTNGPKHPLKKSYSKCLRRTQIRWVIRRSSSVAKTCAERPVIARVGGELPDSVSVSLKTLACRINAFKHSYTVECGNRLRVGVRAKNASVSGFACRPFWGLMIDFLQAPCDRENKAKRNNMTSKLIPFRFAKAKMKVKFGVKYLCGHKCEWSSVQVISIRERKKIVFTGNWFHFNFRVNGSSNTRLEDQVADLDVADLVLLGPGIPCYTADALCWGITQTFGQMSKHVRSVLGADRDLWGGLESQVSKPQIIKNENNHLVSCQKL